MKRKEIKENRINLDQEILDEYVEVPSTINKREMEEKYPETHSEKIEREEQTFIKNLGKNVKYLKQLEETDYDFTSEGLKYQGDETSNILVIPTKIQNDIQVEEIKSKIELKAIIAPTGEELPKITETIQEIENGKFLSEPSWWKKIKCNNVKQVIGCIKELCKYSEEDNIYRHTGVTDINEKKVFLHVGGAIGTEDEIKVDLDNEVLNNFRLTEKEFEIKDTVSVTVNNSLEVAPQNVIVPMLALTGLTPLTSTFEELRIPLGFLTWVEGSQQDKNLDMVTAIGSHFRIFQ